MLEELLVAIERSAPAALLRTSFVVYPLVSAAHIMSIGAVVAYVMAMDARYLGWTSKRPAVDTLLRNLAIAAFIAAIVTGLALFSVRASEYAANPAFLIKLLLLLLAGLNLAAFTVFERQGNSLARASALASLLLWPATLVAGRFIGFV
jgi:hypothetical protein